MPTIPPLGALSTAQQLLRQLLQAHPEIPRLGWLLGRSVYQELYWLRSRFQDDDDLCQRVRHLFGHDVTDIPAAERQLPPPQHLLHWAGEIQEQHLLWLANPGLLPDVEPEKLHWAGVYLGQCHAQTYETMAAHIQQWQLAQPRQNHRVQQRLEPRIRKPETRAVSQGHYRIGARNGVVFDNEQPPQMVELHNYRIQREPLANADYLAFIDAGGYQLPEFWSAAGNDWRIATAARAPASWHRDDAGHWYAISLNGSADLLPDEPVRGLSWHEALAYTKWAADSVPGCQGAVLPHEFQWEVAVRTRAIDLRMQTLEWCSNPFVPYDQYQRPEDPELATGEFGQDYRSIRGIGLHTLPPLQRASYRHRGLAGDGQLGAGLRLVLPPLDCGGVGGP